MENTQTKRDTTDMRAEQKRILMHFIECVDFSVLSFIPYFYLSIDNNR